MIRGQIVFGSIAKGESFYLTPNIQATLVSYSEGVAAIVNIRIGDREIAINEYDKKRGFSNVVVYNGTKWRITGCGSTTLSARTTYFEVIRDESTSDAPVDYPFKELD